MLDMVIWKAANTWNAEGLGLMLGTTRITRVAWADNIWVVASSRAMYNRMVFVLSKQLHKAKLRWKPSSLQAMIISACGRGKASNDDD